MFEFISANTYEALLITLGGLSKEKAKKIVDKLYLEQHGISREEFRKQSKERLENCKWESKPYDPKRNGR